MLAGFPWLQVEKNKAMAEKKPPRLVSLNRLFAVSGNLSAAPNETLANHRRPT